MTDKKQEFITSPKENHSQNIFDNVLTDLNSNISGALKSIEISKGKQKINKGPLLIDNIKDGLFSMESHGFKTEFMYLPTGKTSKANDISGDKISLIDQKFSYQLVIPDGITKSPILSNNSTDIIVLANFINFTKRFVQDNKDRLQTRQIKQSGVGPFFEEDDGPGQKALKYYSKDMFGKHTLLSGKYNFFDKGGNGKYNFNLVNGTDTTNWDSQSTNSIIPLFNHLFDVQKKLQLSRLDIWRMTQDKLAQLKEDVDETVAA